MSTNDSRYTQVRLIVDRKRHEEGLATVIFRDVHGDHVFNRRLGYCTFPLPHGSEASRDPLVALQAALTELMWLHRDGHRPRVTPPSGGGVPPTGDNRGASQ